MEDLKSEFGALRQDVIRLHYRWKMFTTLFDGSELREKLLRRRTPVFFEMLHRILVDDLIMGLARLTDRTSTCGRDNLVLARLVEAIESQPEEPKVRGLREEYERIVSQAQPLHTLRHRLIAHRDYDAAMGSDDELPELPKQLVRDLVGAIAEFMNAIDGAYFDSNTGYDRCVEVGGTEALVACLKKAEEYDLVVDEELVPWDRLSKGEYGDA